MRSTHTCCPEDIGGFDLAVPLRGSHQHFTGNHRLHPAVEEQFHPHGLQFAGSGCRALLGHGPQHPIAWVDDDNPRCCWIQLPELPCHGFAHQLGKGARQFAAGGTTTDDHHGLQESALLGVWRLLGLLKGHEDAPADFLGVLEDLHRWCDAAPVLMAKEGAA